MGKFFSKNPQGQSGGPNDGTTSQMIKRDITLFEGLKSKFKINPLEERPLLKSLDGDKRVDSMLKLIDLKAPFLKAGFQKNSSLVLTELRTIRDTQSLKQYELDLTLAFWFAVHLEDLPTARMLMQEEFLLKQLVACALINKRGDEDDNDDDSGLDDNGDSDEIHSDCAERAHEEWNLNQQRLQQQEEKRESLKSEEQQQYEGGENEVDDNIFDDQDGNDRVNNLPPAVAPSEPRSTLQDSNNWGTMRLPEEFKSQVVASDQVPAPPSARSHSGDRKQQQQSHNTNQSRQSLHSQNVSNKSQLQQNQSQQQIQSQHSTQIKQIQKPFLYNYEPGKKSLGQVLLELKRQKEEEEDRRRREEERQQSQLALEAIGITKEMIENTVLQEIQQLLQVKASFRIKFQNLMTNVLKIALQKEEEKLACIITAYYEVIVEQEMLIKALSMDNYQWLHFLWAFEKNFIGQRQRDDAHFITFDQLFELIYKQHIESRFIGEKHVQEVVDWKIVSSDNILVGLLTHNMDELAIKYMGYYSHFLDKDLFIHCMMHGNNIFLQNALLVAAFDKLIFREEIVIEQILNVLKDGYRTNFLMNVLTLIDISVWKNKHMKDLIDVINDYVEENYDKNRLLLSPNPLLSIALASELLNNVGRNRRKFENECNRIQQRLLHLGRMYSAKIEDEKYYETLIMDQDFQGRTVIKIITQNSFEPLMDEDDPKAENLIVMIWHGKEATRCDGNIYGYSNLMHIITTRAKKMSGKSTSFLQMVSNYFEPNFNVDYSFQYRYRSKAISFFFYKEFFCALAMLVIFQYINYKYLILFSNNYLDSTDDFTDESTVSSTTASVPIIITNIVQGLNSTLSNSTVSTTDTTDQDKQSTIKLNRIISSIREYVDWNFFALFFSGALMFQLLLKIIYNICAKKKIGFDKWTIMDSCSAILNIAAVQLIQRIEPEQLTIPMWKDIVDYFMIFVLCICWLRFFTYFLVIRDISKLLLILLAMIGDTVAFMFIVCCFILIVSSIFTTLYQDTNPDKYGGLALTARNLFDAAIGQYDYDNMGDRELSFSVLQIIFVFFGNILLMNYLIAILSTTYENMKQTGIFMYKVNLYQYCERFMIAFQEESYGEIVLHPPPVSYLSAMMIPFVISSFLMKYITKGFSYLMHWIENALFIGSFILFEAALAPLAYLKVWLNVIANSIGLLKTILNCIAWAIFGIPAIAFLLLRDSAYLIHILSFHQGCRYGKTDELAEVKVENDIREKVYNQTRNTVIALYKRLQRHISQDATAMDERANEEELMEEQDVFHIQEDENMSEDFLYVVKKSLIIDEWRKRSFLQERRKRLEARSVFKISNLKNRLEEAFSKKLGIDSKNENMLNIKRTLGFVPRSDIAKRQRDIQNQLKNVFLEAVKKGNNLMARNKIAIQQHNQLSEGGKKKRWNEEVDMSDFKIPDNEVMLVDEFLTRFTIVSESSLNEHLDIMLMLKALPNKVSNYTLENIEMFNFRVFQESLIAFQNVDLVNAFEYFDEKNRERVQNVKEKLVSQRNNLNDVKDILELVKIKIERNEEHFQKK